MNRIVVGVAALIVSMHVWAGDFRSASFGASPQEVKANEPSAKWTDYGSGMIGFETKLASLDAIAAYIFVDDQLSRGVYLITENHSNKTGYISDFNTLSGLLAKKYNDPAKDETVWLNDLYKDDYSNWGMAVAVGHMSKFKTWETDSAKVTIILTGDNYDITLKIEYAGKKLAIVEKEKQEQEVLDAL